MSIYKQASSTLKQIVSDPYFQFGALGAAKGGLFGAAYTYAFDDDFKNSKDNSMTPEMKGRLIRNSLIGATSLGGVGLLLAAMSKK